MRLLFDFRYCPVHLITYYQIPSYNPTKIISTKNRLFMCFSGPSGSGKTDVIFKCFSEVHSIHRITIYFVFMFTINPNTVPFVSHNKFYIKFIKLSSFEIVNNLRDCMIVFDDTCEEFFNEKDFFKLPTAGKFKNFHVFYVKQEFISTK